MMEDDKPYNKRIDYWDNFARVSQALLLLLIAGVVVFVAIKTDKALQAIKTTQDQQNASTLEARKANAARQEQLPRYVKCLTLARFDNPELASPNVTKQQVSDALDKCAAKE